MFWRFYSLVVALGWQFGRLKQKIARFALDPDPVAKDSNAVESQQSVSCYSLLPKTVEEPCGDWCMAC